jgi:hypothetical protein
MKTLAKILATLLVGSVLATATIAQAAPKMGGKSKGYVHAHTYTKKNGKTVHVKGHYRHHGKGKGKGKMAGGKKMGGMKMGGMKMGGAKKTM